MSNIPSWDEWLIDMAVTASMKSKDPSTQVGCVIVDEDNRPVSWGYNGFVAGCDESIAGIQERPLKYNLVLHAEMNALLFANRDLRGCKLYTTEAPCDNCLKHILQKGIRYIVFKDSKLVSRMPTDSLVACVRLMKSVDMEMIHNLNGEWYGNIIYEELKKTGENDIITELVEIERNIFSIFNSKRSR